MLQKISSSFSFADLAIWDLIWWFEIQNEATSAASDIFVIAFVLSWLDFNVDGTLLLFHKKFNLEGHLQAPPHGLTVLSLMMAAKILILLDAPLLLTHSIYFSSQRSPKFMNQLPTPSPHHPSHPPLPGNSQAPQSQSSKLSLEEVLKVIHSLPNKTSPLDSLPTPLLKKYTVILSPILSNLAKHWHFSLHL